MAARVGIDARYGESAFNLLTGKNFDEFRATILAGSNTLVSVTTFIEPNFNYLDALVLRQSLATNDSFTTAEISDIHSFVNSGHGLLLLAEAGFQTDDTVANLNRLAAPFGVTFATGALHPEGFDVSGFYNHPVTAGVGLIGVDYYRAIATTAAPALDLTRSSGDSDILAAVNGVHGSGNVVLVSDCNQWSDMDVPSDRNIGFGNNRLLLQNIIAFVTVPKLLAELSTNSVRLSWPSSFGPFYHVEWCANLTDSGWHTLTNQVQTVGTRKFVYDTISRGQRFYRLKR